MKLGYQDERCTSKEVCSVCDEELRQWLHGKKLPFLFGIPMIWREPKTILMTGIFVLAKYEVSIRKTKRIFITLGFNQLFALFLMDLKYQYPLLQSLWVILYTITSHWLGKVIVEKTVNPTSQFHSHNLSLTI